MHARYIMIAFCLSSRADAQGDSFDRQVGTGQQGCPVTQDPSHTGHTCFLYIWITEMDIDRFKRFADVNVLPLRLLKTMGLL
jgi:hypothetical protein